MSSIKFQCKQCQFNITRTQADLNNDCPKCHINNPYINPTQAEKKQEIKALTSPNSKAQRVSTQVCPSAPNGEVHTYQLGSCKFCKKAEGLLEDKPRAAGATAYAGGKADCSSGGKHMFAFSKCTKCGMSELDYTKQKKAAAATTISSVSTAIPRVGVSSPKITSTIATPTKTPTVTPTRSAPVTTPIKLPTTTPTKPSTAAPTTPARTTIITPARAVTTATTPVRAATTTTPVRAATTTTPVRAATTTTPVRAATATTPVRAATTATTPVRTATTATPAPARITTTGTASTIKFQCKQCQFNITRTQTDLNNDCPKCHTKNPYVSPEQAAKKQEIKALTSPNSKAQRVSTQVCPSAPNGEVHTYQLGSCKFCKKAEGLLEDKPRAAGATAYAGGKADCSSGGKHMFAFSKCTKCGMSELDYTKQKKAAATTTIVK